MTDKHDEDNKGTQNDKRPRRYSLYDQINVNEKWLDVFIAAMIALLLLVILFSIN